MIVRQFLLWARTAPVGHRAEAVTALAGAYLYSDLSPDDRWEAETALTAMLDDPSPVVRRALAEALANAADAPRHLVVALANDQSDIAALVLSRSPILIEADLVDCAALGDELVQTAVALRPRVPVPLAAALAEIAPPSVLVTLVENRGAEIAPQSLARMVERHGTHAPLREALLARPDLPLELRQAIAVVLSGALAAFATGCGWLTQERAERATREAREKATLSLSGEAERESMQGLVRHLRRSAQLTPALILRAILSRRLAFAEAALADLADLPVRRVCGLMHDARGSGFAALYDRAGLPASLRPAFVAALSVLRDTARAPAATGEPHLSRQLVEGVINACARLPSEQTRSLLALLRRFEVEAAREEARNIAEALADEAALAAVLRHAPDTLADWGYASAA